MNELQVYSALRSRITNGFSDCRVYWYNEQESVLPAVPETIVFIDIYGADSNDLSFGDGVTVEVTGWVEALILSPKGTGVKKNYQIAEALRQVICTPLYGDGVRITGFRRNRENVTASEGNYLVTGLLVGFSYLQGV